MGFGVVICGLCDVQRRSDDVIDVAIIGIMKDFIVIIIVL